MGRNAKFPAVPFPLCANLPSSCSSCFAGKLFFSFQILFSCLGGDVNFSKFFFTARKGEGNLTGGAGRMHLGEREARGECFFVLVSP